MNIDEASLTHPPLTSCYLAWFLKGYEVVLVHLPRVGDAHIRRLPVLPTLRRHLALSSPLIFPILPSVMYPEKTFSENLCWGVEVQPWLRDPH